MNEQLIKFIELCLIDGVITEKEREVIFRKSKELGVDQDECEIILEGMIQKSQLGKQSENESMEPKKIIIDKEVQSKILSLDKNLIKEFGEILLSIDQRLKKIDENPNLLNQSFVQWLRKLKDRLIFVDDKYDPHVEIKDFNDINQTGKGEISFFKLRPQGKFLGKEIIGQFQSGLNFDQYIFTEDYYVQETSIPKTNFWGSVVDHEKKYIGQKKLDDINIFDKNTSGVFRYVLSSYLKEINEFHLNDLIQNRNFSNEEEEILSVSKKIDSKKSEIVYKVTSEIKLLLKDLHHYMNKLGKPIKDGGIIYSNIFSPYHIPVGLFQTLKINKSFYQQLSVLVGKIKFITSIIILRNELLLSLIHSDDNKFNFLKVKLDNNGVLLNYYEKETLSKLDEQIKVLKEGFDNLSSILSDVVEKLDSIDNNILKVRSELENIDNKLSFGNLINVIQSYQLYKINTKTNSLLN